ncbi:MAG: 50S ribosomal protein L35 [Alphaproteobacteria bacterium]
MPKLKNKSSAKKRFKITATGKVRFYSACLRHNTSKRPMQMKRQNRGSQIMKQRDAKKIIKNYLRIYKTKYQ